MCNVLYERLKALLLVLSCVLLFSACEQGGELVDIGKPFPKLSLETLEGKSFEIASLRGKVVIIKLWATWCEICIETEPQFKQFVSRFDPSKVVVLSVSVDSDLNMLREFLIDHPAAEQQLIDRGMQQSIEVLGSRVVPKVFVIDQDGVLLLDRTGRTFWGDEAYLKIQALIK